MTGEGEEAVTQRLHRGNVWRDRETIVGVMRVALGENPPVAVISLTDRTQAEPLAQHVALHAGDSAPVGHRRFVLVDLQRGEQKPFVDFRLEPGELRSGGSP
jgi:hypothetical protein